MNISLGELIDLLNEAGDEYYPIYEKYESYLNKKMSDITVGEYEQFLALKNQLLQIATKYKYQNEL